MFRVRASRCSKLGNTKVKHGSEPDEWEQRANDADRPFGAIVMSGDFDFAPAVHAVAQLRPPVIPMVAGFNGSVAGNYWRGARFGYLFPFSPIILNNLAELGLR